MYVVHKFGGSSLADADCFRNTKNILLSPESQPIACVVSAVGGKPKTTDLLLQAGKAVFEGLDSEDFLQDIFIKHCKIISDLLDSKDISHESAEELKKLINDDIDYIRNALNICKTLSSDLVQNSITENISGYGEIWCARILSKILGWSFVNAKNCIVIQDTTTNSDIVPSHKILYDRSRRLLNSELNNSLSEAGFFNRTIFKNTTVDEQDFEATTTQSGLYAEGSEELGVLPSFIITGYICRTNKGKHKTLGRDGSDYSAAILARLLEAEKCIIWTDVPGVLSGDPKYIDNTKTVRQISYNEALELAHFGSKVLHHQCIKPLLPYNQSLFSSKLSSPSSGTQNKSEQICSSENRNVCNTKNLIDFENDLKDYDKIKIINSIPLEIRKTSLAYQGPFTSVVENHNSNNIVGVISIENISLITLSSSNTQWIQHLTWNIQRALHELKVQPVFCIQTARCHSCTLGIREYELNAVLSTINGMVQGAKQHGRMNELSIRKDCSVLAVIGDAMKEQTGTCAQLFRALGDAKINILCLAQINSERSISVVIDSVNLAQSLQIAHNSFLEVSRSTAC